MTDETNHPNGDYAIVECLGHRTIVGRISEVERFGTKMLSIEPIWQDRLLPAVFIGGPSIYQLTPCSAGTAFRRQAVDRWSFPESIRDTLPPNALPAPDESEPTFSPRFLEDDDDDL